MPTMRFLSNLGDYLYETGTIFTVRRYLYDSSVDLVFIPRVGACRRYLIKEDIVKEDLKDYWDKSGFSNLEDWWSKIVEINTELPKLYLYKIEVFRRLVVR